MKFIYKNSKLTNNTKQLEMSTAETKSNKIILLIIDPQVDFHGGGSLAVNGADGDSERIATFIRSNVKNIDEIIVTMDSHHV